MSHPTALRRAAAAVAAIATGATLVSMAPAQAAEAGSVKSRVTVRASDYEVDPGEQFVLRGRVTARKSGVADASVRVQAYRDKGWHNLTGAVVRTRDDGRYRVRVILSAGGDRDLRVVADPKGDRLRISRAYTVVRVLG